jgi:uncharacterized membrane protein
MQTHRGRSSQPRRRAIRAGPVAAVVVIVAAVATAASVLAGPATRPPLAASCQLQALGTLGGLFGNATAVNRQGVAVGIADDARGAAQPVIWLETTPRRLATGLAGSVPRAVNAAAQVVGTGIDRAAGSPAGWAWSHGRVTRLRVVEDRVASPEAINDRGVIVGVLAPDEGGPAEARSKTPGENENEWAGRWASASSRPEVLSPLPGDQGAHAFAVDGAGRAGGVSQGASFTPVVWEASGKARALATLGGGYGVVRGFGGDGVAVGDAVRADGADHPVMWDAAGRITDLGLPPGARSAKAEAILPNGVIVGTAELVVGSGTRTEAIQWTAPNAARLLPSAAGAAANAGGSTTVVGHRADGAGGRHPARWRCGR